MKNSVVVRALPAIELMLVLPETYPSTQRPLLFSMSKFYDEEQQAIKNFMIEKINEKWEEEMPILYIIAIFIQDELLEEYFQENGYP